MATTTLNLAALTGEELQRLLGADAAQRLLPELTRARMQKQGVAGPSLPSQLTFEPRESAAWGASIQDTRRLRALSADLVAAEFVDLGVRYAPHVLGARHHHVFLGAPDVAAAVRWSETPDAAAPPPFVQLLTLLRDRASGFALVLTSTAHDPPVPAFSEEVALRHLPGQDASLAVAAHRAEVLRHGRGVKVASLADWERVWTTLHTLNRAAWARRGLLMEQVS